VALGSNLAAPETQIHTALDELKALPHTSLLAASSLYRTMPVGPPGQPDYCNAVALLETGLNADTLLIELQAIENVHGRRRGERWGPRTLDLDLLTFGDEMRDDPRLTLPHPRLAERAFVLVPWNEIAGALQVPGLGRVCELAAAVDKSGVAL
jgi:2-amino-4-hydroxy-6-hydroxymethyldihydropteridine diphosphokinase